MSANLELNCIVLHDNASANNIFTIEISSSKNVIALKKAIKEENPQTLQHVEADALILWNVALDVDHHIIENIKLEIKTQAPLLSVKRLSGCFSNLQDEQLHVVVRHPSVTGTGDCSEIRFNVS